MKQKIIRVITATIQQFHPFENVGVHSKIRWYGQEDEQGNVLKYRTDIVIIDESDLRVKSFLC